MNEPFVLWEPDTRGFHTDAFLTQLRCRGVAIWRIPRGLSSIKTVSGEEFRTHAYVYFGGTESEAVEDMLEKRDFENKMVAIERVERHVKLLYFPGNPPGPLRLREDYTIYKVVMAIIPEERLEAYVEYGCYD